MGMRLTQSFIDGADEQQAKLQNKQKIAELLYNVSLSEGLLSEALYRLNAYKEKLLGMHVTLSIVMQTRKIAFHL